jgi:hypothetical protein
MSELDPLELELASLQPREPTAVLKERIAGRLAESTIRRTHDEPSYWGGSLLVGGLLAASLAALLAWQRGARENGVAPSMTLDASMAAALDGSAPTLWSYRRALQSNSLDELLDRHAARSLERHSGASAFMLARSNFDIDAMNGEL